MYNGILPIFKERGLTSHDVALRLRKILKAKKIGHTGTLDPEVSSALPICLGDATKVSDYIMEMGKTYHATITLGKSTTTEDQIGDILETGAVDKNDINEDTIDQVLQQFEGRIRQIPPMYSSVKVSGGKLYEYARNNETVERPERQVFIKDIYRISEVTLQEQTCHFEVEITYGEGTYIRTLATDIGLKLGFPAHMPRLARIASGGFQLESSLTVDQIKELYEHDSLHNELFPIEYGLKGLKSFQVKDLSFKKRICNGQKFRKKMLNQNIKEPLIFVDSSAQKVLAIYIVYPGKPYEIKPKKVFS